MSLKPVVKLYGELHGGDDLLKVYDNIFAIAKKEGAKTCFIEREPFWQADKDELIAEISKYDETKFQQSMQNIANGYKEKQIPRGDSSGVYLAYLAVLNGIKLVHVDVASHPVRMVLLEEAQHSSQPDYFQAISDTFANAKRAMASPEGWGRANVGVMAGRVGWDNSNLRRVFEEIEKELTNEEVFLDKYHEERTKRLSEDGLIADLILSQLNDESAIVIYGKNHIDSERSDSIAGILGSNESIDTHVFHILDDEIVPRPGLIHRVQPEIVSLTDRAEDQPFIQNKRGIIYRDALGVKEDYTEAKWWFSKAAHQGFAEAQYNLACLYTDYHKVSYQRDYEKGLLWARRAAEQGHIAACALLGRMYLKGYGVEKDEVQSAKWYEKAAMAGDIFSQATLGYDYWLVLTKK